MPDGAPAFIYHEKQLSALCGQHCLNNLLQGPYFTAGDLSEIAIELDEEEKSLLADGGRSVSSSNVDEAGNFSEGVLQRALAKHDVRLDRTYEDVSLVLSDVSGTEALVCNLSNHWIAIRRLGGRLVNLNSQLKAPRVESDFHLSAFLSQLVAEGWTIFRVNGRLPPPMGAPSAGGERSSWHPWASIAGAGARSGAGGAVSDDAALSDAIRASLADFQDELAAHGRTEDEDAELVAAIAASLRGPDGPADPLPVGDDDDDGEGSVAAVADGDDDVAAVQDVLDDARADADRGDAVDSRRDQGEGEGEGGDGDDDDDDEDAELRRAIEASLRES